MRIPPIAWAGIVAVVFLALGITAGILTGPNNSCVVASSTTSSTSSTCSTVSPSATP